MQLAPCVGSESEDLVRPVDDATRTLNMLADGDSSAADRLLPLIYADLRALAGSYFRGQPGDHTLEPTALVHEAYLRLIDQSQASWTDRTCAYPSGVGSPGGSPRCGRGRRVSGDRHQR